MTTRWDAVLFDFDGTLALSEERNSRVWDRVLARLGVDLEPVERQALIGRRLQEVAPTFPPVALGLFSVDDVRRFYLEYDDLVPRSDVQPAPGARELVAQLHSEGVKVAVVSSATVAMVTAYLRSWGMQEQFAVIVGGDLTREGKPHPEPYETACAWLSVPPARAFAVEDSPAGVESARLAGVPVAAITSTHSEHELVSADWTFPDIPALARTLLRSPHPEETP